MCLDRNICEMISDSGADLLDGAVFLLFPWEVVWLCAALTLARDIVIANTGEENVNNLEHAG